MKFSHKSYNRNFNPPSTFLFPFMFKPSVNLKSFFATHKYTLFSFFIIVASIFNTLLLHISTVYVDSAHRKSKFLIREKSQMKQKVYLMSALKYFVLRVPFVIYFLFYIYAQQNCEKMEQKLKNFYF